MSSRDPFQIIALGGPVLEIGFGPPSADFWSIWSSQMSLVLQARCSRWSISRTEARNTRLIQTFTYFIQAFMYLMIKAFMLSSIEKWFNGLTPRLGSAPALHKRITLCSCLHFAAKKRGERCLLSRIFTFALASSSSGTASSFISAALCKGVC